MNIKKNDHSFIPGLIIGVLNLKLISKQYLLLYAFHLSTYFEIIRNDLTFIYRRQTYMVCRDNKSGF